MSAPKMTAANATELWQNLSAYEIGPSAAELSFSARLARENRWSEDFAARVINEYKRFCYLACTAGHEVTPCDAVDQAWHLHLTYSRDYWQRFCPQVLQAELHHGPTAGGTVERARYYEQYSATLSAYEAAFGEPPPTDIWPDARRRFSVDPQGVRINPADVMILQRSRVLMFVLVAAAGGAALGWLLRGGI